MLSGTFNQGTTTQVGGGGGPPPNPPAGPGFAQGPRPGPVPNDRDFTASSTAIPQQQGYPQQRGPPSPDPLYRPPSGPPMPEGNQAWQQQQRPPPSAFPPSGPQGYPQHPPQNPSYRPTGSPFPPPQQQQQPPPPQQQQERQGSEQWPGQYAYKQGMEHLKQSKLSGWDTNKASSSDLPDDDESELDRFPRRKRDPRSKPISAPLQQRSQPAPSPPPAPTPASAPAPAPAPANLDYLMVPQRGAPIFSLAADGDTRCRSAEIEEVEDEEASPHSLPRDKKKKHRNPFHLFPSKKK